MLLPRDIYLVGMRNRFMRSVFEPLLAKLHSLKGCEKMTLAELCADDPLCLKLITEMEQAYPKG